MSEDKERSQAWVGDAVLALYAREWILQQDDIAAAERADVFVQMTSNHFLASIGKPTAVEAAIGVVYEREGLEAAFAHIETTLLPLFKKHRARNRRPGSYRDKR